MSETKRWPIGQSITADLIRSTDWSRTSLGLKESWPQTLRTAVDLALASPIAAIVLWGPEHIQIYNDGWTLLHSGRHPAAMGQPTHECFTELAETLEPVYQRVLRGEGVVLEDSLLPVERHGSLEDAWWNVVYTPVRGDAGDVDGIFCTLAETTAKILAARAHHAADSSLRVSKDQLRNNEERQTFLLKLSDALRSLDEPDQITRAATGLLGHWLNASRAYYARWPPGEGYGEVAQDYAASGLPSLTGRYHIETFRSAYDRLSRGDTWVVDDATADAEMGEAERKFYLESGVVAWVDVPLIKRGQIQAALCVVQHEALRWTDHEIAVIGEVAERCWSAIERSGTESELRKSEAKYRTLFDTMGEGFAECEIIRDNRGRAVDHRMLVINQAFERLTGASSQQARGRAAREVFPGLSPLWVEHFDRAVRAGVPAHIEMEEPSLRRWYSVSVYPREGDRFFELYDDITDRKRAEVALRGSDERQAFLLKLSDALRPLSDPLQIQQLAMKLLAEKHDVMRAAYLNVHGDGDTMTMAARFERDATPTPAQLRLSDYGLEIANSFRAGHTLFVCDTDKEATSSEQEAAYKVIGVRAWIVAPLVKGGRLLAVVGVQSRTPRTWTPEEIHLIDDLAERTWEAAERARVESELRGSEERQTFLLKLSDALRPLSDAVEIQAVASRLLGESLRVLRAGYGEVEGGALMIRADYTDDATSMVGRYPLGAFGPALAQKYREGGVIVLRDAETDPHLTEAERNQLRAVGVAAHVTVIICKAGQPVLSLGVHSSTPRDWKNAEVALIGEVAERTWSAVARARVGTALRESEERFRLFVENVREYALVQTDLEGVVTSWNPGAGRLFGYTSAEVLGKPFAMLLPAEDRHDGIIAREMAQLAQGKKNEDSHLFERKDGSRFWCGWITEPVYDDGGKLCGTAKVMRDETERQRAEAALRSSLAEKESLLSEVHHRVKNNLQVITSLLSLQSRSLKDEESLTLFNETRNRVLSISAIHELLYRSSNFADIDLVSYAQRLVPDLIRFYGAQTRVHASIEGSEGVLQLERAVPFGLLLNELISNSLKHGFPNEGTGSLMLLFKVDDAMIHFELKDTGRGLPAEFNPAQESSLGMRLVHILVRQLSGQIEFRTHAGTHVAVRIPIHPGTQDHGATGIRS